MEKKFKQDKGVAGLTIMLSLIVMLFVIGFLIMVFALMGNSLRDTTYTVTSATVTNETNTFINTTGDTLSGASSRNAGTFVITSIWAVDSGVYNISVPTTNGTISSAGVITNATVTTYANASVSYTYVYDADNTATDVMNDTVSSLGSTTDWFDIFIVIGAMVVLILLTVIIITAIRGSGMMAGAGSTNNVGTA